MVASRLFLVCRRLDIGPENAQVQLDGIEWLGADTLVVRVGGQ